MHMHTGRIDALEDDVPFLLSLGIVVHNWDARKGEVYVSMNDNAFRKLQAYGDQFAWQLTDVDKAFMELQTKNRK